MRIILDAMGGDRTPLAPLQGAARAVKESGIEILLCGDEKQLHQLAEEQKIPLDGITIYPASEVITMEDDPSDILNSKKECSMARGLNALKNGEGDAFVSSGNSGALHVGATINLRCIKGIRRAAMAPILPTATGHAILIDGGANRECRPELLQQFGIMGSIYMEKVMGISEPRVALINNGAEACKGRELEKEAYQLLEHSHIHFIGNIEGRDIPTGGADVLITDGFTGNIVLKLYEGMGKFFSSELKKMFTGFGKLGAFFILKKLQRFRNTMDYRKVGGAVLLGISKPVIKAHGSSDGEAFFHAIQQASQCVTQDVCENITKALAFRSENENQG